MKSLFDKTAKPTIKDSIGASEWIVTSKSIADSWNRSRVECNLCKQTTVDRFNGDFEDARKKGQFRSCDYDNGRCLLRLCYNYPNPRENITTNTQPDPSPLRTVDIIFS